MAERSKERSPLLLLLVDEKNSGNSNERASKILQRIPCTVFAAAKRQRRQLGIDFGEIEQTVPRAIPCPGSLITMTSVWQQVRAQSLTKETLAELTKVFSISGQGAEVAKLETA